MVFSWQTWLVWAKPLSLPLLFQQLQGRTLVICPPVLKEYWKDSLYDFGIRSFEVESLGKLEHIIKKAWNAMIILW